MGSESRLHRRAIDSGECMASISGVIGGVRSGDLGAANRLSPFAPHLTLGERLGDRLGDRLGVRLGDRFSDRFCERLGEHGVPLAASNISKARS